MKRNIWRTALVLTAATAVITPMARAASTGANESHDDKTAAVLATLNLADKNVNDQQVLAVYGDAPYGTTPTDTTEFQKTPGFIDTINTDPDVSAVLHVGDIHSGKQYCTENYDRSVLGLWQAFQDPLVYTPGDNEWADCHKAAEGGGAYNSTDGTIHYVLDSSGNPVDYAKGNPVANLDLVRSIFFADPNHSLGQNAMPVLSQAAYENTIDHGKNPTDAKYVENAIFAKGHTLFVTVDVPGGSNNDADVWYGSPTATAEQTQEAAERTAADVRWLDVAFKAARASKAISSVVIESQADMWDPEKKTATTTHQENYEPIVKAIADDSTAFGKPVLLLNGDSHVYQAGNPFTPDNAIHPGYDVPNIERIVVNGSTLPLEWLKLTIDPGVGAPRGANAFGPFSWERKPQPQL